MRTLSLELPERLDFLRGNKSLDMGYPWITMGAIIALEEIIKPMFSVLEFGSGGSTIFFAKRCSSVLSYETNIEWYNKVKSITDINHSNVVLKYGNMDMFTNDISHDNNKYDVILIDSNEKTTNRKILADMCISKTNRYIVVDNYLRWGMNRFKPEGFRMYTFDDMRWNGRGTRIFQRIE
jgi:hypothetical protein